MKNKYKKMLRYFVELALVAIIVLLFVKNVSLEEENSNCIKNAVVIIETNYMQNQYIAHLEDLNEDLLEEIVLLNAKIKALSRGKPVYFTAYNAVPWQTDDTPTITASGAKIYEGSCALSRNLLTRFNIDAEYSYGDTAWFVIPYVIEDTMNSRFKRTADIYIDDLHIARQFGRRKGLLTSAN